MKKGIFVSGTDTGVGKTIVSSLLLSSLHSRGVACGYFKPIQTGLELDSPRVSELTGIPESNFARPTYQFSRPQAPSRANDSEPIQIAEIVRQWDRLDEKRWVVEGAGGLLVPLSASRNFESNSRLNKRTTIRDLIAALSLKLLVVASTRLGTINHTLLTLEVAQRAGIECVGIVLVGDEDPGLDEVLVEFSGVSILTRVPWLASVSPRQVQKRGSVFFSDESLKLIF